MPDDVPTDSPTRKGGLVVAPGGFATAGRRVRSWTTPPAPQRQLSPQEAMEIVESLGEVDLRAPFLNLQLILDLSGSMWGGNDALGLRFELALLAIQALAAGPKRRVPRLLPRIAVEVFTFDLSTHLDTPSIRVDRAGLKQLENLLLSAPLGGSSALGPALDKADSTLKTPCLRVIETDFELLDPDPQAVIAAVGASPVDHTVAMSFRSAPPQELGGERVTVHHIDPERDDRSVVARHIVDAARLLDQGLAAT